MKNFKKFGALLLALVMLIGVLPIETFATGLLRGTEGSTTPVEDIREREVTRNNNSLIRGGEKEDVLNKSNTEDDKLSGAENINNISLSENNNFNYKLVKNSNPNVYDKTLGTNNIKSEGYLRFKDERDRQGLPIIDQENTPILKGIQLKGDYPSNKDPNVDRANKETRFNNFLRIASIPFSMVGSHATSIANNYGDKDSLTHAPSFFEPLKYVSEQGPAYCIDLGKINPPKSPDSASMNANDNSFINEGMMRIVKAGYPYYKLDGNAEWINDELLEYATAIALKIATGVFYVKDDSGNVITVKNGISLDSFSLDGNQKDSRFQIIPTHLSPDYIGEYNNLKQEDKDTLNNRTELTYNLVKEILTNAGYLSEDGKINSDFPSIINGETDNNDGTVEIKEKPVLVRADGNKIYKAATKSGEVIKAGPFKINNDNDKLFNYEYASVKINTHNGLVSAKAIRGIKTGYFYVELTGTENIEKEEGVTLTIHGKKQPSYSIYQNQNNDFMQRMYVAEEVKPEDLSVNFTIMKDVPGGKLIINKTDKETNLPLEGVEFTLTKKDDSNFTEIKLVTKSDGTAETGFLTPGEYILKETKALDGYILNSKERTITIKEGIASTAKIKNSKKPEEKPEFSKVEIFKVSKEDKKTLLDGAEFKIYNEDKTVEKTGVTIDGKLEFKDLEPGKYTIEETKAPEGYVRNEKFKEEIELKANETYKLTIENSKEEVPEIPSGTVVISKTDIVKGSKGIPGAKIEIARVKDENGKTVNEIIKPEIPDDKNDPNVFITDNNGKIEVKNLKEGTYKFKETVAPDGYVINVEEGTFTIDKDSKVGAKANLTNKKDIFVIKKIDSRTKEPLANAKFKIYEIVNGKEVQFGEEFISDIDGKIEIEKALRMQKPTDQASREFVIKEIEAPNSYKKMADKKFVINKDNVGAVENGERVVNLFLENEPFNIKIQKKDAKTNEAIPGTEFEIKGKDVVEKKVTDNLGQIDLSKFAPGEYTVTETKASAGYLLEKVSRKIVINKDGTVTGNLVFTNTRFTGAITKVDEHTGQGLAGAEFIFTSVDNSTIMKVVSGQNGVLDLNGLPAGSYAITEIKAPEGYKLDTSKVYRVTINPDGSVEGDTIIKNAPYLAVLTKVNKEGQGISGAKFEVKDSLGKVVAEVESKAKGQIEISGLKAGEYTIVEKQAPTGYIKSNKEYKITVTVDGTVTGDIKIENEDTFVEIKKVNKDNKALEGAEFEILNSQGKSITRGKTDKLGKLTIRRLPVGSYVIKELKAPVGYALSDREYVFTIEEDGKVTGDTTIINEELEIILTKRDKDTDEYLEGAKFTLKSGNKVIQKLESDRRGEIIIKGVGPGTYTLEETEAPEGYIKADKDFKFTIGEDGKLKGRETDIYNIKASFTIIKKDLTTGAVLEGAEFVIRDKNSKIVARVTTNRNGEALVEGLGKGRYTIEETVAPTGYIKGTKAISFEIDALGKIKGKDTLEIFNKSEGKKIEIPKVPDIPKIPDIPTMPNTNIDIPEVKETPKETVPTETPVKTPTEKVKTGDEDKNFAPIFLVVAALVGCGVFFLNKKKKEENK